MASRIIWRSTCFVNRLIVLSTIMLLISSTHSLSQYQPLVRQREVKQSNTEDAESVDKGLFQLRMREGPDFEPETSPEEQYTETNRSPSRRKIHQTQQYTEMQYVPKRLPNGTITYVFPENAEDELTRTEPASSPETDIGSLCSPENPICSDIRSADENERIDQIMASHLHLFAGVFGDDVVVPDGDSIGVRSDTEDIDVPLCTPRERVIHPDYGFTNDKRRLTIVNTDNYKQGVRVEYCEHSEQPCNQLSHSLGYPTECKQMYHHRTLLAIDPVTGKPYKEQFVLPSCCKCVKKSLNLPDNSARHIGW